MENKIALLHQSFLFPAMLQRWVSPKAAYWGLALLGMLTAAALYNFDPRIPGIYPICPFLGLTGYHCPGCGTLRALHRLLYGDMLGSLGYNAFTTLALPFIELLVRGYDAESDRPEKNAADVLHSASMDLGIAGRYYFGLDTAEHSCFALDCLGSLVSPPNHYSP